MQRLPPSSKLVFASITGGRAKEITNIGSDIDIKYIYIYPNSNYNYKDLETSTPQFESYKTDKG